MRFRLSACTPAHLLFDHRRRPWALHVAVRHPPHPGFSYCAWHSMFATRGSRPHGCARITLSRPDDPIAALRAYMEDDLPCCVRSALWSAHQITDAAAQDIQACLMVIIFIPLIPWRYVVDTTSCSPVTVGNVIDSLRRSAPCQGTASKPALSAAEGCRNATKSPGFSPRIKPTKTSRALATEGTHACHTEAGCPTSGFSDMGNLEPQSLCVRARLQSCRKMPQKSPGFSLCGNTQPGGRRGFQPRIKPTKTLRALARQNRVQLLAISRTLPLCRLIRTDLLDECIGLLATVEALVWANL